MNEIEYKLESTNPVLISHVAEFKLLWTKRNSTNVTLSISVCQALIALVENGLWDLNDALSTFISSISSIKNYVVITTTITHLLILDLKRGMENETLFTLHTPQHPFIIILTQDNQSCQTVLNQMTFIMNHQDPRVKENSAKILRPVFLYILCNPSLNSMDYYMQQVWQLLIKSKHNTYLQTEILLWLCTAETHSCMNTNYRILELAEKAALEKNREYCTALLPMIASLIIQLLKQDSDPRPNFDIILLIMEYCDTYIGNLMLTLMAEIVTLCPAIYLHDILKICMLIRKEMSYNDIFFNTLIASIVKWIAYPSVLCSDALNTAKNLMNEVSTETKFIRNDETVFSNRFFTVFTHSDPYIQLYTELVHCLSIWNLNDILLWLKYISHAPIYLKDKCKLLISGLFLQSNETQVVQLCCTALVDISKEMNNFGSHVLSLILHKLTKCKSSIESKYLLLAVPELMITKENVPIINHTLNMLLNGDKQLKYFIIELYLKALRKEPRCYRFISAAIIQMMKSDSTWYSDATCARAMKYICENNPEHGEKLVPLLSQILNRSTSINGGTASALALGCISALYKASIIDIYSTWRVLAPKMKVEKRSIVLKSLCELLADIPLYTHSDYLKEYDQLIDNIVSKLWECTSCNDVKVINSALKALASFRLEQLSLKTLPPNFKRNLVLPAEYAKTSSDAVLDSEDAFSYIPGGCWIQMLQNINTAALPAAGNLLISFITEEINNFRSGIYAWPQGEPQNFKYLPEKSVIRAVGEYLRRSDKSDSNNHRIITECLRIFAHKYPKPLPNTNWNFLTDAVNISLEAKQYALSIACHQATISPFAKFFIENYLSTYKSVKDADFTWRNNEHPVLYSNLGDLCQAIQPNIIKPFLESTLEHVIEKINVDNHDSIQSFHCIMNAYAQALKNPEICHTNSALLYTMLEKFLDKIDLTCDRFYSYFTAVSELPIEHLERMTSPKMWWEIVASKLKNAIAIRAELTLKKHSSQSPLIWLNEIMDEIVTSTSSVKKYFLEIMQKVQINMQFESCSPNWILNLMIQVQGFFMESMQNHNDKVQFYCDVLFVSVISLSGIDSVLMKQDLVIKSQNVRSKLFPQALTVLSNREDWKHAIPQMMEWLNYMRTSNASNTHKSTFHQALICLKHNSYYKGVWTKYLSIYTDIDI
ncbi:Focadhesin [Eufriesea mexicana]|uniref:Focadhesin n=1 Tax=Eufriesea mexicana TaxID=516756 RepID=A0A310SGJ3_9HYME|nr:Focadhesin [Eufriesea mexicana]